MRLCSIEGCEKKHKAKGLCAMHYRRLKKNGTTDLPEKTPFWRPCDIPGCEKPHYAKGYCVMHYARNKKYGSPHKVRNERHGMIDSPEYKSWVAMKHRCLNPKHPAYMRYGGRGIKICDRWLDSFLCFLGDMGLAPMDCPTIDRIDNDGDYEPGNCQWLSRKDNCRKSPSAKLSMEKAEAIRQMKLSGESTVREIAETFSVTDSAIRLVLRGETWS